MNADDIEVAVIEDNGKINRLDEIFIDNLLE